MYVQIEIVQGAHGAPLFITSKKQVDHQPTCSYNIKCNYNLYIL